MDHVSHDTVALLAALILVIGGVIFIALTVRARPVRPGSVAVAGLEPRRRRPDDAASPTVSRSLAVSLAGLSAGAAVIHLVAAPPHYAEIGDLATGFVVAAIFQAAWIRWCLAGPSRRTAWIGILGNIAIILAWAWTRTVGLPVGDVAATPEPVGFPDGASVVFEALLVAGLVARVWGVDRLLSRRPGLRTLASVATVPIVGLVLVLTSLATLAIASGLDHGPLPAGSMPAGHPMAEHVAAP